MVNEDPWHFERPELAGRVLDALTKGPATALTLFAPRRTGKTEFLLKDLAPLARHERVRIVYVSFWRASLSPLALLLHALESALAGGTWTDRIRRGARALAPKLTLSAPVGGSAEIDLTAIGPTPPTELLLYLDDLLERLARRSGTVILLLDEVQELAKDARNAPLVASLRTSLDTRSDTLKAVFTGSSRDGLRAMFSEREAPFFHFATPLELPPLESPFVAHLLRVGKRHTGRDIDEGEAIAAFGKLHRNPYFFRRLLETLLLEPEIDVAAGVAIVRARLSEELRYPETWLELDVVQRGVIHALAEGREKPYGRAARARVATLAGIDEPSAAAVPSALRTLVRRGLVDSWSGRWEIEDPAFAEWIRGEGRH